MLKAVIFDMDGVLIDSEPLHARAAVLALERLGISVPISYCYSFIGIPTVHMLETLIRDFNLQYTVTELNNLYDCAKYELIEKEGYEPIPYTKELILDLYRHGIKMAIASSSTEAEIAEVTAALNITSYFDKLISGTTVKHPKPAPDVFQKAMTELGVKSDECIIIEDSYHGVCAANAAGVPVIGYVNEHSGKQDLSKACMLIEGFDEIDYTFINRTYQRANNQSIEITVTDRLIIRELSPEDIPTLYQIYQNPSIKNNVDPMENNLEVEFEKHKAYIETIYKFYGYGLWGVFIKETGKLIGRCGIQPITWEKADEIELGYLIAEDYQGNGYATEAAKAILTIAFEEYKIQRIISFIEPKNKKSIHVAEKVGMELVETVRKGEKEYSLYSIQNQ